MFSFLGRERGRPIEEIQAEIQQLESSKQANEEFLGSLKDADFHNHEGQREWSATGSLKELKKIDKRLGELRALLPDSKQ
jgi:hypothetical protein